MEEREKTDQLSRRLELLVKKQEFLNQEINELRKELFSLQKEQYKNKIAPDLLFQKMEKLHEIKEKEPAFSLPKDKSNLEKFIGENLISKIGIVITVIGVVIGAKYSIEHQLISPLARIVLGYLLGAGLMGIGLYLKKNYKNYSAVLVSGAIAILYFITYSAYAFYHLFPQFLAFGLMVLFTILGVLTSLSYNIPVIAHIGLVGAYAVPFMVGGNSGNAAVLFSYITLINIGILLISIKKYWKSLYYSAFGFTWLIFASWYFSKFKSEQYFGLAFVVSIIIFLIFYLIFLDYKLIRKEKFGTDDILLLLLNSFIFYAFGYSILKSQEGSHHLLGLFTLLNAFVHSLVAWGINRQRLADRNLFSFVAGLVLVFITIAIPVQLNGNWVTLLWIGEATLLFGIGRTRNTLIYEKLSYALMLLAFLSIMQDWLMLYNHYNPEIPSSRIIPIFNVYFLTSVLFVSCFGLINNIYQKYPVSFNLSEEFKSVLNFAVPAIFLIAAYASLAVEISNYWNQLYSDSFQELTLNGNTTTYWNNDLLFFKSVWIINYSLGFLTLLSWINNRLIKRADLGKIIVGLSTFMILIFLTQGLYMLSELRESFLWGKLQEYFHRSAFHIYIRYISYVFILLMLYMLYSSTKKSFLFANNPPIPVYYDILLSISLVWILSSEWINLMDLLRSDDSYRLGLSVLWGISALTLVIIGFWKSKRHLRILAIILFAITLLKLFFYDIAHLNTIGKTIIFVSLGILLLIISYLYNRYRHQIFSGAELK